jgi:hypothetical protein
MEIIAKIEILQKSHTLECDFDFFKPKKFKFWILIENYITTNDTLFLTVYILLIHTCGKVELELKMCFFH